MCTETVFVLYSWKFWSKEDLLKEREAKAAADAEKAARKAENAGMLYSFTSIHADITYFTMVSFICLISLGTSAFG